MQFLYKLSCGKPAKDSARMIGSEIMSQPIKINIDYCLTQSWEKSLLLRSHMLTYNYNQHFDTQKLYGL